MCHCFPTNNCQLLRFIADIVQLTSVLLLLLLLLASSSSSSSWLLLYVHLCTVYSMLIGLWHGDRWTVDAEVANYQPNSPQQLSSCWCSSHMGSPHCWLTTTAVSAVSAEFTQKDTMLIILHVIHLTEMLTVCLTALNKGSKFLHVY